MSMAYYQGGCLTIIIPTHSNLRLNRKPMHMKTPLFFSQKGYAKGKQASSSYRHSPRIQVWLLSYFLQNYKRL